MPQNYDLLNLTSKVEIILMKIRNGKGEDRYGGIIYSNLVEIEQV